MKNSVTLIATFASLRTNQTASTAMSKPISSNALGMAESTGSVTGPAGNALQAAFCVVLRRLQSGWDQFCGMSIEGNTVWLVGCATTRVGSFVELCV